MAEPILEIRDLRKSFGALKATDGVSLDLRPGEIHALIGPNGAGKSDADPPDLRLAQAGQRHDPFPRTGRQRARTWPRGRGSGLAAASRSPRWRRSFRRCATSCWPCRRGRDRASASFARSWPTRSLTEPAMAVLERVGLAGRAPMCRRRNCRMANAGSSRSPLRWRSAPRRSCSTSRWRAWDRRARRA